MKLLLCLFLFLSQAKGGVISTAPAITEIISELGKESELLGVSTYCTYPKTVKSLPKVGTPFTPNYEMIVKLKPEIVITQSLEEGRFEKRLKTLGIKTVGVKLTTYADILEAIGVLKKKLSVSEEILTTEILKQEERLKSHKRKGSYALAIGSQQRGDYSASFTLAGNDTFLAEIVNFTGLKNVVPNFKGYQSLSLESLVKKNPDYMIFMVQNNLAEFSRVEKSFRKLLKNKFKTTFILFDEPFSLIPSGRIRMTMSALDKKLKEKDKEN